MKIGCEIAGKFAYFCKKSVENLALKKKAGPWPRVVIYQKLFLNIKLNVNCYQIESFVRSKDQFLCVCFFQKKVLRFLKNTLHMYRNVLIELEFNCFHSRIFLISMTMFEVRILFTDKHFYLWNIFINVVSKFSV